MWDPPEERLFDRLAAPFQVEGSTGVAVVLVHGFTGVPAHFRPLGRFLGDRGLSVSAPLLAGHGTRPEDMRGVDRADWLASVLAAVDELRPTHDAVHLVGLSMGGLLSIVAATERDVASITTINSPIVFRDRRIHLAAILHRLRPMIHWPEEPPPRLDPDVAPYWLTYRSHPTKAAAELRALSRDAHSAARRVRVPALVVQSLVDEAVDPESAVRLVDALGGETNLLWLAASIHNSLLDRERHLIAEAILRHIEAVTGHAPR